MKNKEINFIDNLEELEVNTVKDSTLYKDFKSLTIDERLKSLEQFLDKISISDIDKKVLMDLIKDDALKTKNEIDYDKINKNIRQIKILKYNLDKNIYFINNIKIDNNYEKQIIKSRRNISKLIS
jgi:hypothetical protein